MNTITSGYDYLLSSALSVSVLAGTSIYIKVDGRFNAVTMGVVVTTASGQVQVALEDFNDVTKNKLTDNQIQWTDFQSPTNGSIVTISGNLLYKTLSPAPNIIKVSNTAASGIMKYNFRGSF